MDFAKELYKKWWFWLIAIPIGAWVAMYAYDFYYSWKVNAPYRESYTRAVADYAKYEAEYAMLEAKYRADYDGGETPQETWDMFVAALQVGDVDGASKYFIPEMQEEMKRNFELGLESGAVDSFLNDDTPLIEGGTMYPNEKRFEFYTGDIDGGPGFVYMLVKNEYTGVWKIEDL